MKVAIAGVLKLGIDKDSRSAQYSAGVLI